MEGGVEEGVWTVEAEVKIVFYLPSSILPLPSPRDRSILEQRRPIHACTFCIRL